MTTATQSPLAMLIRQGLESIGVRPVDPALRRTPGGPSETIEQVAGGLLAAMGFKEISEDLDLQAIALLGAASVAGLRAIEAIEPGIHKLESALYALEDLLRRTAPVRV